jgi:hypothetical protein
MGLFNILLEHVALANSCALTTAIAGWVFLGPLVALGQSGHSNTTMLVSRHEPILKAFN